jgi:hypothetical protein
MLLQLHLDDYAAIVSGGNGEGQVPAEQEQGLDTSSARC